MHSACGQVWDLPPHPFSVQRSHPMKLYFHGHNYNKYAAEQMLLEPHGMSHPAGTPLI